MDATPTASLRFLVFSSKKNHAQPGFCKRQRLPENSDQKPSLQFNHIRYFYR